MKFRRAVTGIWIAVTTLLLLGSCTSPDFRPAAVSALAARTPEELRLQIGRNMTYRLATGWTAEGVLRPERFPDWAAGSYQACVYWTDEVYARSGSGQTKEVGRVRGWALVARDLDVHILEISYEDAETGETIILLDQWDGLATLEGD